MSVKGTIWQMPALLTITSKEPNLDAASSTRSNTWSLSDTSVGWKKDRRPIFSTSATVCSADSLWPSRSATTMSKPSWASWRAMPLPIPLAEPVTTATLLSLICLFLTSLVPIYRAGRNFGPGHRCQSIRRRWRSGGRGGAGCGVEPCRSLRKPAASPSAPVFRARIPDPPDKEGSSGH